MLWCKLGFSTQAGQKMDIIVSVCYGVSCTQKAGRYTAVRHLYERIKEVRCYLPDASRVKSTPNILMDMMVLLDNVLVMFT